MFPCKLLLPSTSLHANPKSSGAPESRRHIPQQWHSALRFRLLPAQENLSRNPICPNRIPWVGLAHHGTRVLMLSHGKYREYQDVGRQQGLYTSVYISFAHKAPNTHHLQYPTAGRLELNHQQAYREHCAQHQRTSLGPRRCKFKSLPYLGRIGT